MREINRIYIHCSDSLWGEVEEIRRWHLGREDYTDIGYHFLICNPYPFYRSLKDNIPDPSYDGRVQPGRSLAITGAHVEGDNRNTVGICLVGCHNFTERQFASLFKLLKDLLAMFKLNISKVWGHYEYWTKRGLPREKDCPNLDMDELRNNYLQWEREGRHLSFNVT